jgi:hypothetical protein
MDPKPRSQQPGPPTVAPASEERRVDVHERTTLVPPHDVEAYAREHSVEPGEDAAALAAAQSAVLKSAIRPAPIPREAVGEDLERDMLEHLASKDYAAALMLAESVLQHDPAHEKALLCRKNCQLLLERKYVESMGSLRSVPVACVDVAELRARSLDARAAFAFSLVDGVSNLETILDVSAMPRLDALRLLYELMLEGVIRFE